MTKPGPSPIRLSGSTRTALAGMHCALTRRSKPTIRIDTSPSTFFSIVSSNVTAVRPPPTICAPILSSTPSRCLVEKIDDAGFCWPAHIAYPSSPLHGRALARGPPSRPPFMTKKTENDAPDAGRRRLLGGIATTGALFALGGVAEVAVGESKGLAPAPGGKEL